MSRSEIQEKRKLKLYNSPVEVGMRALLILSQTYPQTLDFQRILYLDYILVNSGDFQNGPESIHPSLPTRKTTVGIRRKDLLGGIDLMVSRGLVWKEFSPEMGVLYRATELSQRFHQYLSGVHYKMLLERVAWLDRKCRGLDNSMLAAFIGVENGEWGAEFSFESSAVSEWYGGK